MSENKKNVLILGATGWLGRSTIRHLNSYFNNIEFDLFSSKKQIIKIENNNFTTKTISEIDEIKRKEYDYYLNFAFLTQDKISKLGEKKYLEITDNIIKIEKTLTQNINIKKSLLFSSGAVYWKNTKKENLYTLQKLKQEEAFIKNMKDSNYYISRIFATIAYNFELQNKYAFTSFVKNGLSRKPIEVKSNHEVVRSYLYFNCLIDFFLTTLQPSRIFDAWNKNYSIVDLAYLIGSIFNVEVILPELYSLKNPKDIYVSKDNFFPNITTSNITIENIKSTINFTLK